MVRIQSAYCSTVPFTVSVTEMMCVGVSSGHRKRGVPPMRWRSFTTWSLSRWLFRSDWMRRARRWSLSSNCSASLTADYTSRLFRTTALSNMRIETGGKLGSSAYTP